MSILQFLQIGLFYPFSRFPQGGKALHCSPSPVGESLSRFIGSWEGGKYNLNKLGLIHDCRYSLNNKT
jgi:hypothetical protein